MVLCDQRKLRIDDSIKGETNRHTGNKVLKTGEIKLLWLWLMFGFANVAHEFNFDALIFSFGNFGFVSMVWFGRFGPVGLVW